MVKLAARSNLLCARATWQHECLLGCALHLRHVQVRETWSRAKRYLIRPPLPICHGTAGEPPPAHEGPPSEAAAPRELWFNGTSIRPAIIRTYVRVAKVRKRSLVQPPEPELVAGKFLALF